VALLDDGVTVLGGAGPDAEALGARLRTTPPAPGARVVDGVLSVRVEPAGASPLLLLAGPLRASDDELGALAELLAEQAARAVQTARLAHALRSRKGLEGTPGGREVGTRAPVQDTSLLDLTIGPPGVRGARDDLVGDATAFRGALALVGTVAGEDVAVLILGETGTGKDVVARAIHGRSRRATGPFVAVNCAAIPAQLVDTELFGHVRGAFTGATADHRGRIEEAHGGTLFLDEIGELPLPLQAKLLRVLDDHRVRPVGGDAAVHVDVRVLAATNRDLAAEVEAGRFRRDLYHRLAVMEIELPPLRARAADIPLLVRHILGRLRGSSGPERVRVSARVMAALGAYPWPGNVRELENELRRAHVLARGGALRLDHFSERVRRPPSVRRGDGGTSQIPAAQGVAARRAAAEKQAVREALALARGNKSAAARLLKLSRPALYDMLKRHGIK